MKNNGGKLSISQIHKFLNSSYDPKTETLDGYVLDKNISKSKNKVYVNPNTNHAIITHQGTNGLRDWLNNAVYALGGKNLYKNTNRYREAKRVQDRAENKYGSKNVSTLGHSQGALLAETLGKNSKEVITLNKATRPFSNTKNSNQYDIKTTGDLVSKLNPFQKSNNEFIIDSKSNNPIREHSVNTLKNIDQNIEIGVGLLPLHLDEKDFTKYSQGKGFKINNSHIETDIPNYNAYLLDDDILKLRKNYKPNKNYNLSKKILKIEKI